MFKVAKKKTAIIIIILSMFGFIVFFPFKTALIFYKENTNQIEAFLQIDEGDTFQLIWRHSIHLKDVVEKYKVMKSHDIKQYEIVYEEFGIGMPSNALEGETFFYKDGKYHVKDLNNIFPSMKIRNGKTVSKNRLAWGAGSQGQEHMVWFNKYFEPGAWFTLKIENISLWDYVKGVKIHE